MIIPTSNSISQDRLRTSVTASPHPHLWTGSLQIQSRTVWTSRNHIREGPMRYEITSASAIFLLLVVCNLWFFQIILLPPSPFSPTATYTSSQHQYNGPEEEIVSSSELQSTLQRRKLPKRCPPPTLPKPIIKKQTQVNSPVENNVRFDS